MLPSRPTLRSWNPDALATSAAAISAAAESVAGAVSGIDTACTQMPETRAWSGRSHEAASATFGRANRDASKVSEYAKAAAAGSTAVGRRPGGARAALLAKADQVHAGPFNVSDQLAVLIDPVTMSADDIAGLLLSTRARSSRRTVSPSESRCDRDRVVATRPRSCGYPPTPPKP